MNLSFPIRTSFKVFSWSQGNIWKVCFNSATLQVCSENINRLREKPRLDQRCWTLHKSPLQSYQTLLTQKREPPLAFPIPGMPNKLQSDNCALQSEKMHLTNELATNLYLNISFTPPCDQITNTIPKFISYYKNSWAVNTQEFCLSKQRLFP